ncbi:hypothetical protein ONZ45_g13229 [Pleurotus djamor]|nr:hypothetical protein ONZ45_g13229 [Pleurotus djamor]
MRVISKRDEARWISFLVLDFGLDIVNGVQGFNLHKMGAYAGQLDEDLRTTTKMEINDPILAHPQLQSVDQSCSVLLGRLDEDLHSTMEMNWLMSKEDVCAPRSAV